MALGAALIFAGLFTFVLAVALALLTLSIVLALALALALLLLGIAKSMDPITFLFGQLGAVTTEVTRIATLATDHRLTAFATSTNTSGTSSSRPITVTSAHSTHIFVFDELSTELRI